MLCREMAMAASSSLLHFRSPPFIICSNKETKMARKNPSLEWGCDTFSPQNAKLLQDWLTAQGLPPQHLALQPVDAGGRGLVAQRSIRKGQKLLFVPSSLIITTDSAWSDPSAGGVMNAQGITEWPFLASYLISEASHGSKSRWNAYIAALPRLPGSILQWSRTDVKRYLSASCLRDQALERIADVEDTYYGLHSSLYSKYPNLFPAKFFTLETLKWAFGILFSRPVRLKSLDERIALVPWADMLNHSSQVHATLDFDISSETVILTSDRAYGRMEQVFISYGNKSNGELFLSYGFIPFESNEDDSVDLLFALSSGDDMFTAKQEALREHGLLSSCRYPLTISGLPVQLVAFAQLAVCPPSMSSQIHQMAATAASKGEGGQGGSSAFLPDVPLDVEIKAYELILTTVEAALFKISRFLEDNQAAFSGDIMEGNEPQENSGHLTKLKLACRLCMSEQRILYRAQNVLRNKLRALHRRKGEGENVSFASSERPGLLWGLSKLFKSNNE